jgi:hypothetical protein
LEQAEYGSRREADASGLIEPEQIAGGTAADPELPCSTIGFDSLIGHFDVAIRAGNHAAILDDIPEPCR